MGMYSAQKEAMRIRLSKCLSWDKPMTSTQASKYLMTNGFVAEELHNVSESSLTAMTAKYEAISAQTTNWICGECGNPRSKAPCVHCELARVNGLLDEVEASLSMAPHKDSRMASIGYLKLLAWQRVILSRRRDGA